MCKSKAFLGLEQSHLRPNRVVTNRNNKLSFFPVVTFVLGFGWPHTLHHDWLKPGLATEGTCLGLRLRGTFRSDYYLREEITFCALSSLTFLSRSFMSSSSFVLCLTCSWHSSSSCCLSEFAAVMRSITSRRLWDRAFRKKNNLTAIQTSLVSASINDKKIITHVHKLCYNKPGLCYWHLWFPFGASLLCLFPVVWNFPTE